VLEHHRGIGDVSKRFRVDESEPISKREVVVLDGLSWSVVGVLHGEEDVSETLAQRAIELHSSDVLWMVPRRLSVMSILRRFGVALEAREMHEVTAGGGVESELEVVSREGVGEG